MGNQGGIVDKLSSSGTGFELVVEDADRDGRADIVVYGHEMKPNFELLCFTQSSLCPINVGQKESVAIATQVINAPIWGHKQVLDINQDGMLDILLQSFQPSTRRIKIVCC